MVLDSLLQMNENVSFRNVVVISTYLYDMSEEGVEKVNSCRTSDALLAPRLWTTRSFVPIVSISPGVTTSRYSAQDTCCAIE